MLLVPLCHDWFRHRLGGLLLCGAGLMIDLVVYLFRWQPFRVWFRFLHRLKKKEPEEDTPDPVDLKTERSPSIPSDRGSEAPVSERPGFGFAAETFSHARKNSLSFREDGDGEEEPVFAPRRPNPSEDALFRHQVEPEGTTASFEQAILPRRRRRISRILQDHDQEDTVSPDQLIDQRAAYRKPVYPRNWKDDRSE